jgi:hypothetical protein
MNPTTPTPISLDELRRRRSWREGAAALLAAVRDLPSAAQELPNDPRDLLRKGKG